MNVINDAPLMAEAGVGVPVVYVISDSLGDTAADVALAAAAQFENSTMRIERLPKVADLARVKDFLNKRLGQQGARAAVFYTIVNRELRAQIADEIAKWGVPAVDLIGPALDALETLTGQQPLEHPGAIRATDEHYFRRIEAMEFFVEHDDGRNPQDLTQADIVLIGVSRTSKTPLSMYLAVHGYKVANIPLAPESAPPQELFDVEPFRIFGLLSTPEVLTTIRTERLVGDEQEVAGSYTDPLRIEDELNYARSLMSKLGCIRIKTNGRAVEETAQTITEYYNQALEMRAQRAGS